MSSPTLNLIGAGRLARVLARLWHEAGVFRIGQIRTRSAASAAAAASFIGAGEPLRESQWPGPAGVWLIGTDDQSIEPVAGYLAREAAVGAGDIVFHCSGALDASALQALRPRGALLASAHPIHSFADPARSLSSFAGSFCALEGDAGAVRLLEQAFARIKARTLALGASDKRLYHAGTVIGSNYLVVTIEAALSVLTLAGVERATAAAMLAPLAHATIDNVLAGEAGTALSGPIARGDIEVVAEQFAALQARDPVLARLYGELALAAIALARARGEVPSARLDALEQALDGGSSGG